MDFASSLSAYPWVKVAPCSRMISVTPHVNVSDGEGEGSEMNSWMSSREDFAPTWTRIRGAEVALRSVEEWVVTWMRWMACDESLEADMTRASEARTPLRTENGPPLEEDRDPSMDATEDGALPSPPM